MQVGQGDGAVSPCVDGVVGTRQNAYSADAGARTRAGSASDDR